MYVCSMIRSELSKQQKHCVYVRLLVIIILYINIYQNFFKNSILMLSYGSAFCLNYVMHLAGNRLVR